LLKKSRMRRVCLFLLFVCGGGSVARAELPPPGKWKLPPVDGKLTGEFNATLLGGAPKLKWELTLRTEKPRERSVAFAVAGYGLHVRGDARLDPMGEGTWRIEEAEVNLGEWFGWLAPRVAPKLSAVSVAGTVRVAGEGTWRGGVLGGHATVSLRDGRIDDSARKVLFEGLACNLVMEDIAARRTAPAQVLTWTSGHYDLVELGTGQIEFSIDGDKVQVAHAGISVFGGLLEARGVSFSTQRPEFTVSAQVTGFEVGKLVFLLPQILSHARGKVDGYVDLSRDSRGIAVGAGYLGLREGETAELRFVPTPGIISTALPPSINKLYPGLGKMETEGIPMEAEVLKISFVPERDELGRTAWLHVAGQPVDPSFKGPIDLMINIRGPLDQVINFGASSALRLMGR
jgi:hypothetical protein